MGKVEIRRTRLQDVNLIAEFINKSRPLAKHLPTLTIAERFSEVGFLLAEYEGHPVGLLGWQVENLVVRVTDFLIAPAIDRVIAGRALIGEMEKAAQQLQVEAVILFLPPHPSQEIIDFWETFDYTRRQIPSLNRNWREVAEEWRHDSEEVMLKAFRERIVHRPI
ncbi:MAG TPA: hypothetical protein G4N98_04035 [Thermoflexia bacterium]|nr:hypothetical protein [Thermoflexia bacterium]